MRLRTGAVLAGLFVLLGALVVFGIGASPSGGTLEERWVSDTPRDNVRNHHAVGVGPDGDGIVAPLAEVPGDDATLTGTSCSLVRLAAGTGAVEWQTSVPPERCFTHALTEPAIGDIDDDGRSEVAVATTENALVVYDGPSGREEFRVPLSTYGYGRPTIADVRPEPGAEIVVSDVGGNVVVASADGSVVWRASLDETLGGRPGVWDRPVVADVDADGSPEIVVGSSSGVVVLSADGAVEWSVDGSATYIATARAGGAVDVIVSDYRSVRAYDGATGDVEWTRELTNVRLRTAADGDGDGTPELYVGRPTGTVLALDATTGATEWSTRVVSGDGAIVPPPAIGDVDGDGSPEVVAVTKPGTVAVLDAASGVERAAYERTVPIWTFPAVVDIDGDGRAEILVRYGDGRVVTLAYAA